MLILGLQGSPRKKGNSQFLLSTFLQAAERRGAVTRLIRATERRIEPCKEFVVCETRGTCPIHDDMESEIYGLLRRAEVVVLASPIFFYNMTAQLKAVVDRCQVFWSRKYRLKLSDPLKATRRGVLLGVGATRGKTLFDGMQLTAKYFFDAIDAKFETTLFYRGIEGPKDMSRHPSVLEDVERTVDALMRPYVGRRRVLFVCRRNAARSQLAGALAQVLAGDRLDVAVGGSAPAAAVDPDVVQVMAEKGIDLGFRVPQGIDAALASGPPDVVVTLGCADACPSVPAAAHEDWDVDDPTGRPIEDLRRIRDDIEARVRRLIDGLKS